MGKHHKSAPINPSNRENVMIKNINEVETLEPEEMSEDEFYQISREYIANNSIYRNMEMQLNNILNN